ncbi:hypothetical protein KKC59_04010, partial [bacterium]|nr:hypothetical protein [bacterium]
KDKDATMADPSIPLSPEQADQELDFALRGQSSILLTGSTAQETLVTYYQPLIQAANRAYKKGIPFIAIQTAFKRIMALPNDTATAMSYEVELKDGELNFIPRVENNKRWDDVEKKWVEIETLKVETDGMLDKQEPLRKPLFNWSIQAYFIELFKLGLVKRELELTDVEAIIQEIKQKFELDFSEEDYSAIEQLLPEEKNLYNSLIPMRIILERILKTKDLAHKDIYQKLLDNIKLAPSLDKMKYKESFWVFGSITGDELDKAFQRGEDSEVAEAIINEKIFWQEIQDYINAKLQKDEHGGLILALEGKDIPIRARYGRGYYNWIAGGTSKVNMIDGLVKSPFTNYRTFVIIGDSPTDQGQLPVCASIKVNLNPSQQREIKDSNYLSYKDGILEITRQINYDEYQQLVLLVGEESAKKLFGELANIYSNKAVVRALLSAPDELTTKQLVDFMNAQVLRFEYAGVYDPEKAGQGFYRFGPAVYYHIMDYVIELAKQGLVLDGFSDLFYLNQKISQLHNKEGVSGFRLFKPVNPQKITTKTEISQQPEELQRSFAGAEADVDGIVSSLLYLDKTTLEDLGVDKTSGVIQGVDVISIFANVKRAIAASKETTGLIGELKGVMGSVNISIQSGAFGFAQMTGNTFFINSNIVNKIIEKYKNTKITELAIMHQIVHELAANVMADQIQKEAGINYAAVDASLEKFKADKQKESADEYVQNRTAVESLEVSNEILALLKLQPNLEKEFRLESGSLFEELKEAHSQIKEVFLNDPYFNIFTNLAGQISKAADEKDWIILEGAEKDIVANINNAVRSDVATAIAA